ncbi:hypothetical protein [Desulfohalovibrio reitneri]|nr:hypothetical protein [Desulfohalovibrio reitneri]
MILLFLVFSLLTGWLLDDLTRTELHWKEKTYQHIEGRNCRLYFPAEQ